MARRVFFSFHHQQDSWRVGQVRNAWLTNGETNQFLDAAAWEEVERKGEANIKNWIDEQLKGTSVTAVLIGAQTARRKWVRYEIEQSIAKGNGLVGVFIHGLKDRAGRTTEEGSNPLDDFRVVDKNPWTNWLSSHDTASAVYPSYYWFDDNGRENLNTWIEDAARKARR